MTPEIELPPLPGIGKGDSYNWTDMEDYARSAIKADRKRGGEPVAWLRNERYPITGLATLDPLFFLGSHPPSGYTATYSPLFLAPQPDEPVDEGPWTPGVNTLDGRHFVESDDFTHDVRLYVDGDFGSDKEKKAYATGIARQLNSAELVKVPSEQQIIEAAEQAGLWPNTVRTWIPQFQRYHALLARYGNASKSEPEIDTSAERVDGMDNDWRQLAASLYQACGAYDMPVRVLDVLSAAANGEPFAHLIDGLLPVESPAASVEPVADCYSNDDGDTWLDYPDDADFLDGLKLGDEYELQASTRSWPERFRVTKVPDDVSDEYEVEPISIRTAAPVAAQAQPEGPMLSASAVHMIVAGALYDMVGWLTSREKRIILSASNDASPAVDAISEFAEKRGLSLDNAAVGSWHEAIKVVAACCGRSECGSECGNDWQGMTPAPQPVSGADEWVNAAADRAWARFQVAIAPTDDEFEEFVARFADEQGCIHGDTHAAMARALLGEFAKRHLFASPGDAQTQPSGNAANEEPVAILRREIGETSWFDHTPVRPGSPEHDGLALAPEWDYCPVYAVVSQPHPPTRQGMECPACSSSGRQPSGNAGELDERVAFEWWASDEGHSPKAVERATNGIYRLAQTQSAWSVWQARAALAAQLGAPEPLQYSAERQDLYVTGWNDCRAAMLSGQPGGLNPVAVDAARQRKGDTA